MAKKLKYTLMFVIFLMVLFISNKVNAAKINTKEVTLYMLDESYNEYDIYLPEGSKTEFKLEVSDTNYVPVYSVADSYYVSVSKDGLIKLGYGKRPGTYEVNVEVGKEKFIVKVNVIDYLQVYVDNKINKYISENITDSMTQYEKLDKICEFVAKYNYSWQVSSYQGMIVTGGGDCWASSSCIMHMCDLLGIKNHLRPAPDEGGSGHRNVSVLADGKVYIAEAGFDEEAPREYLIKEEKDGFSFAKDVQTNELFLNKYDGFEENVIVPSTYTIDYYYGSVTEELKGIGSSCFSNSVTQGKAVIKSVTLPDTITKIYDDAFNGCKDLTTINIPKNVKEIEPAAFSRCYKLTNFKLDPNNQYFTFEDGILYNKDKTEVIMCLPSRTGEIVLDENVKVIKAYAFFYCSNISGVKLGPNVEKIEQYAFAYSNIGGINIPKSVKEIGDHAFGDSTIKFIRIEDGCQAKIDSGAFSFCINLYGVIIPDSITDISDDAFSYISKGLTVFYVKNNSYALNYANQKSYKYEIVESTNNKQIYSGMIILEYEGFTYDGTEKKPKVIVVDGGTVLEQGKDYNVSFSNNINASNEKAKVIVTGTGKYYGSAEKTFSIEKANNDFCFTIKDVYYGQKVEPIVISNISNESYIFSYKRADDTSSNYSRTVPTEVGTYYVQGMSNVSNYQYKEVQAIFSILPAPYIKGDINQDKTVNINDVNYGIRGIVNKITLTEQEKQIGDVNNDGTFNINDINTIMRFVVGKIHEL